MGKYSKLIGGFIGAAVGYVLAFLAIKVPGVASCADPNVIATCTFLGVSQQTIVGLITSVLTLIGVYSSPANTP